MSDLAGAMYEVPPTLLDMWLKGLINDDEDRRLLIQWAERARGHGQPVALVGAGMSLNAVSRPGHRGSDGRPARAWTWRQMEEAFKAALPRAEQDGADPLWLAELYERSFGRAALINLVHRAVPADALEPGPAHRELLGIPWHTLLTTNYDDLLERAWQNPTLPLRRVWKEEQLASPRPGGSSVIHLHGVLDDPTSIVLTLESYRRYPQTHPGLVTKVRQLFMEHPLLMIGFSAVDPNFVQWMGWVEDVLGDLHPLHLNLFVTPDGATPSAPRRTYWHDRVRFVPCRVADLEKVLEAIGKFLRGIPRSADTSLPDDLVTYLRGSTSPADAMARLNTLWGMDPARKDDNDQRQEGLDIVATHLAELRAV
ncbi:MAG TPA: SIR2 family protein, partial [Microthrixaceae bacterium]|nr:SIR2 family protein [Microthrixaceae bacterium]